MLNIILDEVFIDDKWVKKLDAVCQMLGTTKERITISMLVQFMEKYCDANGNFSPKEAVLYQNVEIDGERKEIGKCFVLDEITMLGQPYYKVLHHGSLMKVPQYCVVLASGE